MIVILQLIQRFVATSFWYSYCLLWPSLVTDRGSAGIDSQTPWMNSYRFVYCNYYHQGFSCKYYLSAICLVLFYQKKRNERKKKREKGSDEKLNFVRNQLVSFFYWNDRLHYWMQTRKYPRHPRLGCFSCERVLFLSVVLHVSERLFKAQMEWWLCGRVDSRGSPSCRRGAFPEPRRPSGRIRPSWTFRLQNHNNNNNNPVNINLNQSNERGQLVGWKSDYATTCINS